MRLLILIFILVSFPGFSQDRVQPDNINESEILNAKNVNEKMFQIEILVTQTTSYCGGVKPPDELLKEMETPKPLAEKKLYLKKGEKNTFNSKVELEICSDSLGKIRIQIPPGKYFIVNEFKKDTDFYKIVLKKYKTGTKDYPAIDKLCLKKWYEQPDLFFEIMNEDLKNLTLNFNKECSWREIPCLQFKGQLPN